MKSPTYPEQFDKITRAYLDDSLRPLNQCACFIGNLLNNTYSWSDLRKVFHELHCFVPISTNLFDPVFNFYSMEDICLMENNFIRKCYGITGERTEESLYNAMDTTLDILRKIHESKGEIIELPKIFNKRQLQVA